MANRMVFIICRISVLTRKHIGFGIWGLLLYRRLSAWSGGRKRSWIIYCCLVWCERKILFLTKNLQSFTSKRTGCVFFTNNHTMLLAISHDSLVAYVTSAAKKNAYSAWTHRLRSVKRRREKNSPSLRHEFFFFVISVFPIKSSGYEICVCIPNAPLLLTAGE